MKLFSRRRRAFLRRVLTPYERPTIAVADVPATPTAVTSASGTARPSTASGKSRTTRSPQRHPADPESQPSTRIDAAVARFVDDLHGA